MILVHIRHYDHNAGLELNLGIVRSLDGFPFEDIQDVVVQGDSNQENENIMW